MPAKEKLKPKRCPFCKYGPQIYLSAWGRVYVACASDCRKTFKTERGAIAAWNRRVGDK